MIDYELYCKIKDYRDNRQLTVAQLARELHLDKRTVERWVAAEKFQPRKAAPRPSKLDPYKKQIVRWLESHPCTAAQIFLRLREAGYTGGIIATQQSRCIGHARNGSFQLFEIDGFDQMLGKTGLARSRQILFHTITGEGNSLEPVLAPQVLHQIEAAAIRQAQVADHQIEWIIRR